MEVPRHHRGHRLRSSSRRLAVAAAVITVVGLVSSAAAANPAADPSGSEPVALTAADLARLAAGTPASVPLTLLTGDTVQVSLDADGNPAVQQVTAAPRPGGVPVAFHTLTSDGDTYLVPDDALPLLAEDLLDRDLFNLRELAKLAAYGRVGATPVLVTHPGRTAVAAAPRMAGASTSRPLPSIDATAMTIDGRSWWPALVGAAGAEPAALAAGPLAGVEKIWLDGLAEIALDESVPQVGAPVAWARGLDGTGVTVAVLDTGVDAGHPDLSGKVVEAVDFTGSEVGPVDGHGHGTHVATTIAGSGAASGGLRPGVAPGAQLLIGKVCGDNGGCPDSAILAGMEWAAQSGAPVVSMSLGGGPTDGTDPMSQAVNNLSQEHGTLFVIAAGNAGPSGQTVGAPGAADEALTVAAVDKQDRMASFSSRGPRKGDLAPKPDIAAPGVDIVAGRAAGTTMGTPVDEHYTTASGTSMATPHVSGAAAILAQQSPDLIGSQLKALLMSTSVDIGARQVEQGSGRLDVSRAIDPSVFVAGSGSFGRRPYPHQPVTRSLTYHNVTDEPVTLTLTGSLTGPGGNPDPAGLLALGESEITVPAGGSTRVSAVVDGSVLGEAGPFGAYRGSVDATDPDGTLRSRTLVTAFLEPQRFPVDLELVLPDGATDVGVPSWWVTPVDDQTELHPPGVQAAVGSQAMLFPGTYSISSQAITWRDQDGHLNQALVSAPEVTVTGQPATVRFDLRQAKQVRVVTPEPAETYSASMQMLRTSVNEDWSATSNLTGTYAEEPHWWTLPTEPVSLGSFGFGSTHVLVPPAVRMSTFGSGAGELHPRYGTADVTAAGGAQSWEDEDGTRHRRTLRLPVPRLAGGGRVPLVHAGAGLPDELAAASLDGAIAVIRPVDICPVGEECDFAALRARVAGAADRGAVGVLVAGAAGWVRFTPPNSAISCPDGPERCPPVEPYAPIPILRLPAGEADDLLARLARGPVWTFFQSDPELPRAYALSFTSGDGIPDRLPHRVGHRDLEQVEHRFHADRPGEVTSLTWLRVKATDRSLGRRTALPRVATQRSLTVLVQRDREAIHVHSDVQTAPYLEPSVLDGTAATTESHAYIVDRRDGQDVVSWNLGPIVPGTGVAAPTTRSGFQPPISSLCPGCREGDVLYPSMYLTTADGHGGELVGIVNDTGLTSRLFGITPCEPPDCLIRLSDATGNELEQRLVTVQFGIGGGLPTTEEANR